MSPTLIGVTSLVISPGSFGCFTSVSYTHLDVYKRQHEYTLWMDGEEVMVRANQLEFAGDEMEEGMNYYDEESLSLCGVEDFLQVVAAYRNFVQQK